MPYPGQFDTLLAAIKSSDRRAIADCLTDDIVVTGVPGADSETRGKPAVLALWDNLLAPRAPLSAGVRDVGDADSTGEVTWILVYASCAGRRWALEVHARQRGEKLCELGLLGYGPG
jgi:ketosteroid isomerase-like protein